MRSIEASPPPLTTTTCFLATHRGSLRNLRKQYPRLCNCSLRLEVCLSKEDRSLIALRNWQKVGLPRSTYMQV